MAVLPSKTAWLFKVNTLLTYTERKLQSIPPIYRMLDLGIPVGAGSDATRVSGYNPWVALYWMVLWKTIGGLSIYDEKINLIEK